MAETIETTSTPEAPAPEETDGATARPPSTRRPRTGTVDDVTADTATEDTGTEEETEQPMADLLPAPAEPDELERQLNRDEEMERQNRHQHHEAPHFRKESD